MISLDVVALTLSSVVDCDKPDCTVVVSIDSCWLGWSLHEDGLFAAFGSKATRDGTLDARFKICNWHKELVGVKRIICVGRDGEG